MLSEKHLKAKNFNSYKKFLTVKDFQEIQELAAKLKHKKIFHLNAVPTGGGVAEILKSLVPLQISLGLRAKWYFIKNDQKFFKITKKIHDAFQGLKIKLPKEEKEYYLKVNQKIASSLKKFNPDLVIVHDPQPLAVSLFYNLKPMILRIHIDLTKPNLQIIKWLLPCFKKYKIVIFSLKDYVGKELKKLPFQIVYPAIDPLTSKNQPLTQSQIEKILKKIKINPHKPLIAQISRFDRWKDPLGVINAYHLAKKEIPELQLALLGSLEIQDDPTAFQVFSEIKKRTKNDKDVFLLTKQDEFLINALQSRANPVLQKSIREGFGLTVAEAMLKGRVVVGGNVGGIKLQIKNGINGFLVESPEEAAQRIVQVIKNPKLALKIGRQAKKSVEKRFLLPRLLKDHLKIYNNLLDKIAQQ